MVLLVIKDFCVCGNCTQKIAFCTNTWLFSVKSLTLVVASQTQSDTLSSQGAAGVNLSEASRHGRWAVPNSIPPPQAASQESLLLASVSGPGSRKCLRRRGSQIVSQACVSVIGLPLWWTCLTAGFAPTLELQAPSCIQMRAGQTSDHQGVLFFAGINNTRVRPTKKICCLSKSHLTLDPSYLSGRLAAFSFYCDFSWASASSDSFRCCDKKKKKSLNIASLNTPDSLIKINHKQDKLIRQQLKINPRKQWRKPLGAGWIKGSSKSCLSVPLRSPVFMLGLPQLQLSQPFTL